MNLIQNRIKPRFGDHTSQAALIRVASKGVYAGGGSIVEEGRGCKLASATDGFSLLWPRLKAG